MSPMSSFFKRNIPVFVIGLLTVVVFIAVTVASQSKDKAASTLPILVRLGQDPDTVEEFVPDLDEQEQPRAEDVIEQLASENQEDLNEQQKVLAGLTLPPDEVNQRYGYLEIKVTSTGIEPKNATGWVGQIVRWTNETDNPIELKQTTPMYEEWKNSNKVVAPGGTVELQLTQNRLWTYRELNLGFFGSIYANRPNK